MQKLDPATQTVKTSIGLPLSLYEEMKRVSKKEGLTKSEFIRKSIKKEVIRVKKAMERK